MENTISTQLYSLLLFTVSGIIIGIFFDIFRILRRAFKTPDFITYLEDMLFWILTGIFLLFVLFQFQNGEIRSYVIVGLLTGIFLYMLTISKYFIKFSVKILITVKEIVKKIVHIFLYPVQLLLRIIKKPIHFFVIRIKKISTSFRIKRQKKKTECKKEEKKQKKIRISRRNFIKNVEKYK